MHYAVGFHWEQHTTSLIKSDWRLTLASCEAATPSSCNYWFQDCTTGCGKLREIAVENMDFFVAVVILPARDRKIVVIILIDAFFFILRFIAGESRGNVFSPEAFNPPGIRKFGNKKKTLPISAVPSIFGSGGKRNSLSSFQQQRALPLDFDNAFRNLTRREQILLWSQRRRRSGKNYVYDKKFNHPLIVKSINFHDFITLNLC